MTNALAWLELTSLSVWIREDPSIFVFPLILALHTIGLALLTGLNTALDLRVLGAAPGVPLAAFRRFDPVMWAGLWLNVVTGVLLLVAYPAKALTNPVFYLKLALIGGALAILQALRRLAAAGGVPDARARRLAVLSLVCWAGAITAGRLLAYTYSRLMASSPF